MTTFTDLYLYPLLKYKYHENDLSYCACITHIFWIVC